MEDRKTLDKAALVSNLGQAQNLCDKTLDEATELSSSSYKYSGSLLLSDVSVGENGGGFNVQVLSRGFDIEKGIQAVESDSEEIQINGVKNADLSVPKASSKVNRNVQFLVEETAMEDDIKGNNGSQLNDVVDQSKKIEVSGNGFSLFVEVFGPPNGFIQRDEAVFGESVSTEDGVLLSSNEDNPKASEIHESDLGVTQDGTIDGFGEHEEAIYNQESELSIGDLVWVETKTQSWWPGMIFDPSNAPKVAPKSDQSTCLLVKYFGHGGYVWCSPLQLKPFIENFAQMSVQSNSVNFLSAVKKAVDEFGRRIKLQMTCTCKLKENQTMPTAPLAGNGGSQERTSMPEDKMCDENSVTQFEPANFLAFVKNLAQHGSMPGMLEFAATQNRLSAFYHSIGHCQVPMHQLRGTTDVKDGAEVSERKVEVMAKLSGTEKNTVLKKCRTDFSKRGISSTSGNKEGNKDSEVRNVSVEVPDIDICKLASSSAEEMTDLSLSPTTKKSKVSTRAYDERSGGKSEKVYETRERRRSKYLSPPFVNENETEDGKGVSHVVQDNNSIDGQSLASPPIINCSGKKVQKKRSKKTISEHNTFSIPGDINASSADMLSELGFAALDCLYPNKNRNFSLVERFFSGFRRLVFHDESKGMSEESKEPEGTKPSAATPDKNTNVDCPGSVGKDTHERNVPVPNVTSKRRVGSKKKIATTSSNTKPSPVFSDVNGNPTNGSFIINFQEPDCLAPDGKSLPKKRKKARRTLELLQDRVAVDLPDLNGNCTAPRSAITEDPQVSDLIAHLNPELKKRKRSEGAASLCSKTKSIAGLADVNGNNVKVGSFLKDAQVMGSCSTQDIAKQNNREEGMKGADSFCLNSVLTANQPDINGNNAEMNSFVKVPQQMLSPGGKPEPKKRKRKEKAVVDDQKTKVSSAIPDLNGNVAEPSSLEKNLPEMNSTPAEGAPQMNSTAAEDQTQMNSTPAEGKPQRKRRIRSKPVAWMPEIIVHNKEQTNGEALGTALFLKFDQGFQVPSKETLVTTFCGFGPLNESETQALGDSDTAQVIFINSSDARNAFRSLEKSKPFGPALVNYRLHLSAASRASEADTNLHMAVTSQSLNGFKPPAKPYGLKSRSEEAPDLSYIRKNLEMMTTMLEKAGDNLSPEMRAKLENDIKGLMKKVSTMAGSSSTS
ncbi:hypothetical protein ACSBR2_042177 [Camellia fascicularis]